MEGSEIESYINAMDTAVASTDLIKNLKERVIKMKTVEIGKKAPDFTLSDPEGNPISLYSKLGPKLLLVDFWAGWCRPCRMENPNVVKVYKEFNKKGFDVFGVSLDRTKEDWLKAIADDKLTWTHVSDLQYWNNAAAKLYAVNSIPANFLLDDNGIIIGKNLREEALYNKVRETLAQN
jgi:peroxiredoxin